MKIRVLKTAVYLAFAICLGGSGSPARAEIGGNIATGANSSPANYQLLAQYIQGGIGTSRPPRNSEVPLPGSGRRIPVSARDAAADTWQGCQNWSNRFKEGFQRCCRISSRGLRSCYDQY